MIYVGIDPGRKGGYASIAGNDVEAFPWDDVFFIQHMHGLAATGDGIMACVEKVGAMPGQGVTSMFSFGKSAGFIEGALMGLGIPFQLVSPRKWKSEFGLDGSKQRSIEVCRKLFPNVDLKRTDRCRTESDGMAESLLLACYASRKF